MNLFLALLYVFHQFISSNLDLYYLASIIVLIASFHNNQRVIIKSLKYLFILLLYGLFQILINLEIDIFRLVINILKIYLNIFLFLYIRYSSLLTKISVKKVVYYISS